MIALIFHVIKIKNLNVKKKMNKKYIVWKSYRVSQKKKTLGLRRHNFITTNVIKTNKNSTWIVSIWKIIFTLHFF